MAALMTFFDRGNGTGTDVGITGLLAPAAIYTCKVQDGWPIGTWLPQDPISSAVSRGLNLPCGFYWAMLVPGDGTMPYQPQAFRVTNGHHSAAEEIEGSIIDKLKMLKLPEVDQKVYSFQNFDWTLQSEFPCIQVTSVDLSEAEKAGTNLADEIHYPYRVIFIDMKSPTDHTQKAKYQHWRQSIYRAFRNQPLLGLAYVKQVLVTPLAITPKPPDNEALGYFFTGFNFEVSTSDPRGWGV